MTPTHKSLLRAGRFMALLGLVALSFTEEITGFWLQTVWIVFALSLILDRFPEFEKPLRRWETLGVISLVSLTLLDFMVLKNTLFVVVAHFLLVLQALKLIGLKERKDCLQIGLIGFFQLLAGCTLSAEIWQAILLVLLIPGTTALLFWNYAARVQEEAEVKTHWPDRSLRKLHTGLSLAALPLNIALTVVVFVIFPRLTFNVRVPGFGAGHSAYTDQITLEQTGSVAQDRSVAAWMGFPDEAQRSHWNTYLRGDILDSFNGKEWLNAHLEKSRSLQPDRNGVFKLRAIPEASPPLHATLTLMNTTKNTLFTPGTPLEITAPFPHLESTDAGDFHWGAAIQHPLRYQILVMADERQDSPADPASLALIYGQLPKRGLERIQLLSQRVAGAGSAFDKAHTLERYLRDNYKYTLNFGQTIPDNPVDHFLFESREGFCIHFASALAVMLRLEKIPSRVVAGYYRGEWNPLAGQILFREQDAHAWVEAWTGDRWITLDPSPRASLATEQQIKERFVLRRIRETWDYLGYEWDRFIIEYDLYAQLRAWEHLRSRSDRVSARWLTWWTQWRQQTHGQDQSPDPSRNDPEAARGKNFSGHECSAMCLAGIGVFVASGVWMAVHRARKSGAPVFYRRFLRRMARQGVAKNPAETGTEFAQRASRHLPKQALTIEEITSAYYRFRFGKK